MSLTHITVAVSDLARAMLMKASFWSIPALSTAWPRATDFWRLASGLKAKAVYELADGTPVELEYGFARVEFVGQMTVAQIIFGPPDAEPILGTVALENVGVIVDPVSKTIKRLHAKPLKGASH